MLAQTVIGNTGGTTGGLAAWANNLAHIKIEGEP